MTKKIEKTVALTAISLAGALALGTAHAAENPFAMQDLGKGYQVAAKHMEGGCGASADGDKKEADKDKKAKKAKDGKCGEGKCGGDKKTEEKK